LSLTGTDLNGPEQYDAAVVGIRLSDGEPIYAERVGGTADDSVWAASLQGRELVLTGSFGVDRSDGSFTDGASYARLELPSDLVVSTSEEVAEVGQTVYATVATTSGKPLSGAVSGPCELRSGPGFTGALRLQLLHVGQCTVTFTQEIDGSVHQASATVRIDPLTPVIFWTPRSLTYPTPLGSEQLTARVVDRQSHDLPGAISFSETAGTVLGVGHHTLTVYFHSSSPDVRDATDTQSIYVSPGRSVIRWPGVDQLVYGMPLPAAQVDAGYAGPIQGQLYYQSGMTPGTVLHAGSYTTSVGFESQDPNYASNWQSFPITVRRATTRVSASTTGTTLVAVLRDINNDTPLAGRLLKFQGGSQSCTARTDATGTATCSIASVNPLSVLTKGFKVFYGGEADYAPSSTQADFLS
jgi:hypothetical protein